VPLRGVFSPTQAPVPDWLLQKPERPRVAISLGLSQREFIEGGWDYLPSIMEAVADLDIRCRRSTRWRRPPRRTWSAAVPA
jgi:glycosyltransferase